MVKKYKKEGWVLDRVKGSHHIMVKGNQTVPIPVHGNESLKKGLERALLKKLEEK